MKKIMSVIISLIMVFSLSVGSAFSAFAGEKIFGVDVSQFDGEVNFVDVKNNNKNFVMIRLGWFGTSSGDHVDDRFWRNVKEAYDAKLDFGVYLYSYAFNEKEAKQEADFVIRTLSQMDEKYLEYFTLPVAYDIEDSTIAPYGKTQITKNMVAFCNDIKNAGYTPMVYANVNWYENYIDINTAVKNNYKIWCASWYNTPNLSQSKYTIGNTGVNADMWQYTEGENNAKDFDENVIFNAETFVKPLHHSVGTAIKPAHNIHVETTPATLEKDGTIITKCSDCSYAVTETIYRPTGMNLGRTSYEYTGKDIGPGVTVTDASGKKLVYKTDYTLTYAAGRTNVGTYGVTINFIGKYSGSKTLYFDITPKTADKCTAKLSAEEYAYTGSSIGPGVTVTDDTGRKLVYKTDYTLTYDQGRIEPGRYQIKVNYQGNYSGWDLLFFTINEPVKVNAKLSATSYVYTGKDIGPGVTVTDENGKKLTYKTDYTLTYAAGRTNVGRYGITVNYIGKFAGTPSETLYFDITAKPASQCTAKLSATEYAYSGKEIGPGVSITDNTGRKLVYRTDYTLTYDQGRKEPGRYSVVVNYIGNYSGTQTLYFTIKDPAKLTAKLSATSYVYTGKDIGPGVTVTDANGKKLTYKTDYTLTYAQGRTNVGRYGITVNYIGKFAGTPSETLYFDITAKPASQCTAKLSATEYAYSGKEIGPGVSITDNTGRKLVYRTDYTLTYDQGRKEPGRYSVVVNYIGNYSGTQTLYFTIKEPAKLTAKLSATSYVYSGKDIGPGVTVTDENGKKLTYKTDYTLTYAAGRTNVGRYGITVNYIGKFAGTPSETLYFDITAKPASQCTAKLSATEYAYSGKEIGPGVSITDNTGRKLVYRTDYTLTYDQGRTEIGRYSVVVNYIGNYSGTETLYFNINDPAKLTAKLAATSYVYSGKDIGPAVTVTDGAGKKLTYKIDYTLTYAQGRTNVGRYGVTVNYIGKYSAVPSETLYFDITPKSADKCSAKPSTWSYSYYYTGDSIGPGITVTDDTGRKLVYKTDYTLVYEEGRVDVGRYYIKVNYQGNYTGSQTIYFYIIPGKGQFKSVLPLNEGFIVNWYSGGGVTPESQISGYQIQYSRYSDFSNAATLTFGTSDEDYFSSYSTSRYKMGSKVKYYVRIRTFTDLVIDGKSTTLFSGWSDAKNVTTAGPVTKACPNNSHSMVTGNSGKWFNSLGEADIYANEVAQYWGNLYESGEITWEEYTENCPYGYEAWSCRDCEKWTINFKYD